MRSTFERLILRTVDAAKLFHEVRLRGQASGRVTDDNVNAAGFGGAHRIKNNGGGVAARLRNHFDTVALAPDGELLARGGAERVACCENDGLTFLGKEFGQFADCCRFACAVNPRHHDDEGF